MISLLAIGAWKDESFVAARDERLFWNGYVGRQGLVYIGEKFIAGVKIYPLGVL